MKNTTKTNRGKLFNDPIYRRVVALSRGEAEQLLRAEFPNIWRTLMEGWVDGTPPNGILESALMEAAYVDSKRPAHNFLSA